MDTVYKMSDVNTNADVVILTKVNCGTAFIVSRVLTAFFLGGWGEGRGVWEGVLLITNSKKSGYQ